MEYYIELKVGLDLGLWYHRLQQILAPYDVRWQGGYYHITTAFLCDISAADADRLRGALEGLLAGRCACCESFGMVGAFATRSGMEHIVYAAPKLGSENLISLVYAIRQCCMDCGFAISPDFKTHVTLGRVGAGAVSIDRLQALTDTIGMPDMVLRLDTICLVRRNGHKVVGSWRLK